MTNWQTCVDKEMMDSGALTNAAMLASQDGAVLAKSQGFEVTAGEGYIVVQLFKDLNKVESEGVTIAAKHYDKTRADDFAIAAKHYSDLLLVIRTGHGIIIGTYPESKSEQAEALMENVAQNLDHHDLTFLNK
eukprot:gene7229-8402_t